MNKPKTFEHFPEDSICPACGTNKDSECILIPIDGTEEGNIMRAIPVHTWCAMATNYNQEMNVIYRIGIKNK